MLPYIPLTVWPSRRPFQVWSALKSIVSTPCHLFIIERLYIGHMDGGSQQLLQHNICSRFKVLCSQSSEYYVAFTVYIYIYIYVWSALSAKYYSSLYGSTKEGCHSCSWSAEQERRVFPVRGRRSRLRIWPRETVSAVPTRVSSLILLHHTPSG